MKSKGEQFSNPQENIKKLRLGEGKLVADFGAGSGVYTHLAASIVGETGSIYAVDIQKEILSKISNDASEGGVVEVLWGDIDEPNGSGIKSELLDAVILSNTLFQLENKEQAALEVSRVLKSKGKVLLIDWSESFGGLGPQKSAVVSKDSAVSLFTKVGFEVDKELAAGAHHNGVVFTKI